MHMLQDEIVAIPPDRQKAFGGARTMLLPSPRTVALQLLKVPRGKLVTMEVLRRELARLHGVETVCPFQTKQALRAIAGNPEGVAFWRLVASNGELLKYLPGGIERQAAQLAEEHVPLEPGGSGQRVRNLKASLHTFTSNDQVAAEGNNGVQAATSVK
ncbi:MGMT family protein [Rhizobacter sp. SG703]|uniref:MGMT family protein n=1 Tax=Rhizobacter sp. SG703 TaxID=2587140 RepID=UPI0014458D20|nr:MGMT family protein [Rhizobacter sp. SG703]NKI96861.1 alkylated DNA nucleotide flippase Atl1 [Rhizobacter sp. SG703]